MLYSRERRVGGPELLRVPAPLIALGAVGVERIIEIRSRDVQFAWVDADDGAVDGVQVSDVEGVLAAAEDVVVEFIPIWRRKDLRQRIFIKGEETIGRKLDLGGLILASVKRQGEKPELGDCCELTKTSKLLVSGLEILQWATR